MGDIQPTQPAAVMPLGSDPTAPTGADTSSLLSDRASLTGSIIPGLERDRAMYETQADVERTYQERVRDEQAKKVQPLEDELAKGFMASGLATAPPQHNIGTLMQTAPLFMTMAAMLGSKGRLVGTAGISAVNGMVNGLVKGDVQQYEEHRAMYDEKVKGWHEYAAHIKTIIAEMQKTYGDDARNSGKAEMMALRMAGDTTKEIGKAVQQVATIDKVTQQLKEIDKANTQRHQDRQAGIAAADARKAAELAEKSTEFADKVKREAGVDLDKTIKDIDGAMAEIRKSYEGKKMPDEDAKRLNELKQLQADAIKKRLGEEQPKPTPQKAATPEEAKQMKADADAAVKTGKISVDAAKKRLAASGVTDWQPQFGAPGEGRAGMIQR
jgi:hypothetical protein